MANPEEELAAEFESIRHHPEYPFGRAQRFVAKILALPPTERYSTEPLLVTIDQDSFDRDINIPNLDLASFRREKVKWESKSVITKKAGMQKAFPQEDDFNEILFRIYRKHESLFSKIKGHFIFKMGNVDVSKTRVIFLCDDGSLKHPQICSLDKNNDNAETSKMRLMEFTEKIQKDIAFSNQNYLAVLLITPSLDNMEIIIPHVKKLGSNFDQIQFVQPIKRWIQTSDDYELRPFNDGLEKIESYSNKIFNNRELSFNDEVILKQLFHGNEMILDYAFLKKGNTGANVIEIQPLQGFSPSMSRFVVKYSKKKGKRKIWDEKKRHDEFIGNYSVHSYGTAEYSDTPTHEGIKYRYASSDGRSDSYSFSRLVEWFVEGKDISKLVGWYEEGDDTDNFSLASIIVELFDSALFNTWKESTHRINKEVGELYGDYLKSESKILKSLSLIRGMTVDNIEADPLVLNYRTICEYKLNTQRKICHGDLHSENFFKDKKDVYLIDFGWTGYRHSLIDYATLECSLRFKHLPFYVPTDQLEKWDNEFLRLESFQKGFDLSFVDRPIVRDLYLLVHEIRKRSLPDAADQESVLEYLIALFIISFRQIQYTDLNQRYAWSFANLLGNRIMKLIAT